MLILSKMVNYGHSYLLKRNKKKGRLKKEIKDKF